jgi:BASS family bile acid:Na+ symporter
MYTRIVKKFAISIFALITLISNTFITNAIAGESGEKIYKELSMISRTGENSSMFYQLNNKSLNIDWSEATTEEFQGNLRILTIKGSKTENEKSTIYLLRKLTGEIYTLYVPAKENPFYLNLQKMSENKMNFKLKIAEGDVGGKIYSFARFTDKPVQPIFDRIFKISIIAMLFLIMVGMGMTLTVKEFAIVFKKPLGIFVGEILQFGIIPLLAVAIGHFAGFYNEYPYVYVGFILIAVSPGGVTSNLMTHYAKGDLALSISITSFSTFLALFFTPFLLQLYCQNVPQITIPVKTIVLTVTVLVAVPLIIGMFIKGMWSKFAEKATPFFSALGIIAVVFIMVAGVISNLEKFADIDRYGLKFYSMVFVLTMFGMILGGTVPKLFKINNYQARAISLETGLRNSALAMTIALLIQDQMGDFHSSMFTVSGIFGLMMFIAGLISILSFNKVLPIKNDTEKMSRKE